MTAEAALAGTSLFTGLEQRRFPSVQMPSVLSVSVITVTGLRLGVLAAQAAQATQGRAARLRTLGDAMALDPLPVDDAVADAWAELRAALRYAGLKMPVNDSWIAATAIAHGCRSPPGTMTSTPHRASRSSSCSRSRAA